VRQAYVRSFLAIIILLQSFVAVADAHQFHQSDNQHEITSEHVHAQATLVVTDTVDQSSDCRDCRDCHHCCHCHSKVSSALTTSFDGGFLVSKPAKIATFSIQYSSEVSPSLFRPPIA